MLSSAIKTQLQNGDSSGTIQGLGAALDKHLSVMKATYDFSKGGGAVGDIILKDPEGADAVIPSGSIIRHVLINVTTALTSGGLATIALKSESAADLKAATAVASYSLNAMLDGTPVNSAATSFKLTADRTIKATVAVAALTAGVMDVYISYVK